MHLIGLSYSSNSIFTIVIRMCVKYSVVIRQKCEFIYDVRKCTVFISKYGIIHLYLSQIEFGNVTTKEMQLQNQNTNFVPIKIKTISVRTRFPSKQNKNCIFIWRFHSHGRKTKFEILCSFFFWAKGLFVADFTTDCICSTSNVKLLFFVVVGKGWFL